ncbi:MAG: peptidylprolyl isomerase [Chloroflexi bacterium]|nr:peptidylprolyl isomerase [Chloroflexota bacterium]
MQIDTTQDYVAILRTAVGDITVDLYEKQTPITVNNFVVLALNGFYDNTTFHRVIADFMVQGGDPTGTGTGGPGYEFADEIVNELRFDKPGKLAMANRGFDTNGSQFFITLGDAPWLNDRHAIFGEVIEGMDVVTAIQLRDPDTATDPGTTLIRVDIETR